MRTLGARGPQNALLRVYWLLLISQITWCPSVCPCLSVSISLSIRSHHAAQISLTLPDSGQVLRLQVYTTTPGTEGFYRHDS